MGPCLGQKKEKAENFLIYWRGRHVCSAGKRFWGRGNMMNNSSSPAHSTISTTAIVGGGGGAGSNGALSGDDFHFPCDPITTHERKDEAMLVLKSDLMAALDKEVKSLDDDNWKFEGPRSRMHLISSRGGGFSHKPSEISENWNLTTLK